jgi:hypothetical protein
MRAARLHLVISLVAIIGLPLASIVFTAVNTGTLGAVGGSAG